MPKLRKHDDVEDYIGDFSTDIQEMLQALRHLLENEVPNAKEKISYGIPTIYNENGNIVHYAAYGAHIGFYPGPEAVEKFKDQLKKYETSKGTVKFPTDEPLPLGLIRKITRFSIKSRRK